MSDLEKRIEAIEAHLLKQEEEAHLISEQAYEGGTFEGFVMQQVLRVLFIYLSELVPEFQTKDLKQLVISFMDSLYRDRSGKTRQEYLDEIDLIFDPDQ